MANSKSGDSSLDRLVRILQSFDAEVPAMTVGVLATRARLPLATAYRLVDQLAGHEFLRKDDDGRVRLGLGLWERASRGSTALDLREAAMPYMDDIQAVVGQHTQLGVLRDDEVLFIERLSGRGSVANQARVAGRLPIHKSSSGVVLLAFSPSQIQEGYFRRHPRTGVPGHRGPGGFRRLLAEVRAKGFAALEGLVDEDTTGIAVPVRGPGDHANAALGVVVASGDGAVPSVLPALLTGARGIARAMGERPRPTTEIPIH